jgi:hypothetical protein
MHMIMIVMTVGVCACAVCTLMRGPRNPLDSEWPLELHNLAVARVSDFVQNLQLCTYRTVCVSVAVLAVSSWTKYRKHVAVAAFSRARGITGHTTLSQMQG